MLKNEQTAVSAPGDRALKNEHAVLVCARRATEKKTGVTHRMPRALRLIRVRHAGFSVEDLRCRVKALQRPAETAENGTNTTQCMVCLNSNDPTEPSKKWVSAHNGFLHAMCVQCREDLDTRGITICPMCRRPLKSGDIPVVGCRLRMPIPMEYYDYKTGYETEADWVWHQKIGNTFDGTPYVMLRLTGKQLKAIVILEFPACSARLLKRTYSVTLRRGMLPFSRNLVTGREDVSVCFYDNVDEVIVRMAGKELLLTLTKSAQSGFDFVPE